MTVPAWPTAAAASAQSWTPAEDQYLLKLLARGGPERRCVGRPLADLMAERFGRAYNHQQIWLRLTQICPANPTLPQSKLSPPQLETSIPKRISRLEETSPTAFKKEMDAITPVDSRERAESEPTVKRTAIRPGPPPPRGGTKWRQEEMSALIEFVDTHGKDWSTIADLMTSRFGTRYRRYSHFTVEFKWRYMKRLQPAQFARSSKPATECCESDFGITRQRCHSDGDLPSKKARSATAHPIATQWAEVLPSVRLETVDHFMNRIFATSNDDHFIVEH